MSLNGYVSQCEKHALFERIEELEKENEDLKDEIALKNEILRKYKKENEKLQRVALRKGWE